MTGINVATLEKLGSGSKGLDARKALTRRRLWHLYSQGPVERFGNSLEHVQ
jgi:hypothetical protein